MWASTQALCLLFVDRLCVDSVRAVCWFGLCYTPEPPPLIPLDTQQQGGHSIAISSPCSDKNSVPTAVTSVPTLVTWSLLKHLFLPHPQTVESFSWA